MCKLRELLLHKVFSMNGKHLLTYVILLSFGLGILLITLGVYGQ